MNLCKLNPMLYLLFAGGVFACSSAAPKPAAIQGDEAPPPSDTTEAAYTEPDRAMDECAEGDDKCEEAKAQERLSTLDRIEGECKGGRMSSCGFLYRSGPDGIARLKAPGGPLRWFKESGDLTSIEQPEMKISVFDGTPIFVAQQKGTYVIVSFPQIRFVDADGRAVELGFKTPASSLSILPRKLIVSRHFLSGLTPSGVRGVEAGGFERFLASDPNATTFVKTECSPLLIVDDQKRGGRRLQQIYQLIDGAGVTGWTREPIDYDLGPCYSSHSLIFASDELTSDAVLMDENKTASAMDALWQKGFAFFEYRGEDTPCVRRTVDGPHSVIETSGTGRKSYRVERQGIHLMFFGPAVTSEGNSKPAYGDAELYTVLSITDDALLIAPGAERGERIVAYRPDDARKWWRTEGSCESYRARHPRLKSISR